jgi:integrase
MRLSDRKIKDATPKAEPYRLNDDLLPGLAVRVYPGGQKTFSLRYYNSAGSRRELKIGTTDELSIDDARRIGRDALLKVREGQDPSADRRDLRSSPTLDDLRDRYMEEHAKPRKRSWKNDDALWRHHLSPAFGKTKVPSLTLAQVQRFHQEHNNPITANRALEVLRVAYRLARTWGWTTTDPCSGIQKHVEEKRRHYFPQEHLEQLEVALTSFENDGDPVRRRFALMIRLLLLSGCRLREVMVARRTWVALDRGWIVIPYAAHKTGGTKKEDKVVVLSDRAVEVVRALMAGSNSPWLVAGEGDGPLSGYRRMWLHLLEQANLPHYRVHDLRHTFATYAITHGAGLETVKALLGHASIQSTERYAYLLDGARREAANSVAAVLPF